MLIECKGKRIITDPGSYTIESHAKLKDIDYVFFTHEHADHFHVDSLKVILTNNPKIVVYANSSVSDLLSKENITHNLVKDGDVVDLEGLTVAGIGTKHAQMHRSIPQSANIGFFFDNRFWYPGDSFTNPNKKVEILALPVSGPWMKLGEAIDFALEIKPKFAFPVHDGTRFGAAHIIPKKILSEQGIDFVVMVEGDERDWGGV